MAPAASAVPAAMAKGLKYSGGPGGGSKINRSLREVYEEGCMENRVTPNSVLLASLPEKVGVGFDSDVLDLSRNYVGNRGLVPVLSVVQKCPHLKKVVFSDNGLRNAAVKSMCVVLASHPDLTAIDLSDNYISEGAGEALVQLVKTNDNIVDIQLLNTKIETNLRLTIKGLLEKNKAAKAEGQ
eukprot:TRINITY_DN8964_c0_g1_i1.p1 TRINITY_DN8964_c0_g1~~TRINITY_DN8964_c0_g1_i1.p1  ORF type:complete len:183 (+),score=78.58 TRINITY_DN8964_c0_g1_i1:50-598(+)